MEKENDIGTFFQDKLASGSKSPNDELWMRIEDTLDKEDKQRKGFFIFWLTAIGIPILLTAAWLIFIPVNNHNPENKKIDPPVILNDHTMENENREIDKSETKDTISISIPSALEVSGSKEVVEKTKTDITSKSSRSDSKNPEVKPNDGYTVKSTYHYFNSESGEQVETSDKAKIDSLMNRKEMVSDSLLIKDKTDLIELKDSL